MWHSVWVAAAAAAAGEAAAAAAAGEAAAAAVIGAKAGIESSSNLGEGGPAIAGGATAFSTALWCCCSCARLPGGRAAALLTAVLQNAGLAPVLPGLLAPARVAVRPA